jgi:hypothetical protein
MSLSRMLIGLSFDTRSISGLGIVVAFGCWIM